MPLDRRCRSEIDAGTRPPGGSSIVVSWACWDALSEAERDAFRARSDVRGVRLSGDHRISSHFVEMSDGLSSPLSSEHPV